MESSDKTGGEWMPRFWRSGDLLGSLVLFCVFVYCCWQFIDLRLIYHGGGVIANFPVFYWGWDFLHEFLSRPGGLLNYAHALLSQGLFHPLAGPLAIATLAALLYLGQDVFLRSFGANRIRFLGYAPPLLLLGLISKYTYYVPATLAALSLLAALVAACVYAKTRPSCIYLRSAWVLGLGALFYIAASEAFPIFLVLCLFFELRDGMFWRMLPALLLLSAVPFLSGRWIFDLTTSEVVVGLFPFNPSLRAFNSAGLAMLHALYLGFPACVAVWLLGVGMARLFFKSRKKTVAQPSAAQQSKTGPVLRWIIGIAILVVGTGALLRLSANAELKAVLQVDYFCYRKMWPQALEAARSASDNIHVICAMNQALYHTGRLGDDLPLTQNAETLLLYDQKYRPDWNVIDVYLDLGFINMANHYLVEAVDIYGERPSLLRRLALVNAAIGNTGTARIYLNSLKRVPFHDEWAKGYLRKMAADPSLAADEEVAALRQGMMKDDHIIPLPVDQLMLKLLEKDKHNRMAYEYFTASCFLTKNIQMWIAQIARLEDFNWGELPRYYQEAIVLAVRGLGMKVDIKKRRIGEQYVQRFDSFIQSMKSFGTDRAKAAVDLRKEYGDTLFYFYYLQ